MAKIAEAQPKVTYRRAYSDSDIYWNFFVGAQQVGQAQKLLNGQYRFHVYSPNGPYLLPYEYNHNSLSTLVEIIQAAVFLKEN